MIQCKRKNDLTLIITICGQPVSLDYIHTNDLNNWTLHESKKVESVQ